MIECLVITQNLNRYLKLQKEKEKKGEKSYMTFVPYCMSYVKCHVLHANRNLSPVTNASISPCQNAKNQQKNTFCIYEVSINTIFCLSVSMSGIQ